MNSKHCQSLILILEIGRILSKNLAIVQARMSSSRFPGKVLREINDIPAIKFQIERIRRSKVADIVVATSVDPSDDLLVEYLKSQDIEVRRGSLEDVAARFAMVLDEFEPEYFLRLTADCPFVMPELIDEMIEIFEQKSPDYLTNTNPPTYPDGLDVEVVKTSAFRTLISQELTDLELEHVTLGFIAANREFQIFNLVNVEDLSRLRWTVDYEEDMAYIKEIMKHLKGKEFDFGISDVIKVIESNPQIRNIRGENFRNIALKMPATENNLNG